MGRGRDAPLSKVSITCSSKESGESIFLSSGTLGLPELSSKACAHRRNGISTVTETRGQGKLPRLTFTVDKSIGFLMI